MRKLSANMKRKRIFTFCICQITPAVGVCVCEWMRMEAEKESERTTHTIIFELKFTVKRLNMEIVPWNCRTFLSLSPPSYPHF